ncbi:MAG TPA: hypothetical protein V6C52_00370 [Coleofasciculaceae cyanobacterium]
MSILPQEPRSKGKYVCHVNADGEMECEWREPRSPWVIEENPMPPNRGAIILTANSQPATQSLPPFPWQDVVLPPWETESGPYQGRIYKREIPPLPPAEPNTPPRIPDPVITGRVEKGDDPGGTWGKLGGVLGTVIGTVIQVGVPLGLALLQKRLADSAADAQMQAQAARDFRQILEAGPPPIYQPIQAPNNIPLSPMPSASAPPSSALRNMAQQSLATLREAQHQSMLKEARQLHETSQGRPDLIARLMDAYDPSQMAPLPPIRQNQPTEHDTYNPPVDPEVQQAFKNLLNPPSGASMPSFQEDQRWIQENLAHAAKPLDVNAYMRRQQEQAMAEANWQTQSRLAAEQAETERLKQNLLRMQQQVLQEQNRMSQARDNRPPLAPDKGDGNKTDVWDRLEQGEMLDDREMKHLFHTLDLRQAQAPSSAERIQAEMIREFAIQKMAVNTVNQAERTEQGEVLIQGFPVRFEDAPYFAEQDIRHFEQTDRHLSPNQISGQAYSYSGNQPGTRPSNENAAAYQMLGRSADELERVGITDAQRIRQAKAAYEYALRLKQARQRLINQYTDDQLKREFGPYLGVAAFQLAGRIEQNQLLYGLDNLVQNFGKAPTPDSLKAIPELKPSELSLLARYDHSFPWMKFIYKSLVNTSILKIPGNSPTFFQGQIQGKTLDMGEIIIKQYHKQEKGNSEKK